MIKTALTGGVLSILVATGVAAAATPGELFDEIQHSLQTIDNGVIMTVTTDNEDLVERIQEKAQEDKAGPQSEDVVKSVILLDNGAEITLTSDDPDVVERLQDGPPEREQHGQGGEGERGEHGERPEFADDITFEQTQLDNGVQITITSDNEEAVEHIIERADNDNNGPEHDDVEREVEILDNGVEITLTSDDPDVVERLQEGGPHHGEGGHGKGPRPGGERGLE